MSKYTMWIVFDVQSSQRLNSLEHLQEFVKSCIDSGFNLCVDRYQKGKNEIDEVLKIVRDKRLQAIDELSISDNLNFQNEHINVSIGFEIHNFNLFAITVSSGDFSREKSRRYQTIHELVKFCIIAYNSFAPDYGYGITSPESYNIESSDLLTKPDAIFDYNFYGPNLVKKIGQKKILACPTWNTIVFENGGILLELSEDPIEHSENDRWNCTKSAEILGLRTIHSN